MADYVDPQVDFLPNKSINHSIVELQYDVLAQAETELQIGFDIKKTYLPKQKMIERPTKGNQKRG